MNGAAKGTSQAISRAIFTRPIAVADFVMLRMRQGILYGTSIDTACKVKTMVNMGVAFK